MAYEQALMGPTAVIDFPVRQGLYKTQAEFNESSGKCLRDIRGVTCAHR
jgi:hypothetical protein